MIKYNQNLSLSNEYVLKKLTQFYNEDIPNGDITTQSTVNPNNIKKLKEIKIIDGFLIGGASQKSKNFIDIVKKTFI